MCFFSTKSKIQQDNVITDKESIQKLHIFYQNNNSYEITMNGYQARKINEIINAIFGLQLWETFLSVMAEVRIFTKLSTSTIFPPFPNIKDANIDIPLNSVFKKANF